MRVLMAVIMQNGLIIQQLQLMVVLKQKEIKEEEQRGGLQENRWEPLKCRVMASDEERMAAHSIRREAQQAVKCWCHKLHSDISP